MQTDKKTEVNGTTLSYTEAGKGDVPLIFIHSFPVNRQFWQPQLEELQHSTRVICYDLRGFGQSGPVSGKTTMEVYADDLVQLMDKLGIEKAVVCGLSLGGYILLNAAGRYSNRFKGIVLCDTQCLADSAAEQQKRYDTIKEVEEKGLSAFADKFVNNAFTKHTLANNTTLVEKTKQLITGNPPAGITAALDAMAQRSETCSGLKSITIPTLILCGKEDEATPYARSEFMFNTIPGANLYEIEKAAHFSNLEQPAVFNRHLLAFIQQFT